MYENKSKHRKKTLKKTLSSTALGLRCSITIHYQTIESNQEIILV